MLNIMSTVDIIGEAALIDSILDRSITELQDTNVTSLRESAFRDADLLEKVVFGYVKTTGRESLRCKGLQIADFYQNVTFEYSTFEYASALKALILRSPARCTAKNDNVLANSGIAKGTGYIYVPSALVDNYKTASGWSTYASQFRALEDYTVDGTTTGALDETKI